MDFRGCVGAAQSAYLGADGDPGYKILAWDSKAHECHGTLCESQEIIHLGSQTNKGKGLPIFIQESQRSKRLK